MVISVVFFKRATIIAIVKNKLKKTQPKNQKLNQQWVPGELYTEPHFTYF